METAVLYEWYQKSTGVSTDTRTLQPGQLFFALRGPAFDGNRWAAEALGKGAVRAVVDDASVIEDDRYIRVDDVLEALQALAQWHRSRLRIPIIGLTGSNGKTTSKELLHAVLRTTYRTFATRGNLNNHIGVPLSLLSIGADIEMAIIEMGANHVGEIARLCALAQPTHGFITNIGKAHIGTFGGFGNIIRGKSELYQHLINTQGVVFINSQNEILATMAKRFANPVFYPGAHDYYPCELVKADPFVVVRDADGNTIESQLVGAYNFENIAVALCIGRYFNVPSARAAEAIRSYVPGNMRSQVIKKGSNTVILDAYNANPTSMEAAIRNLAALPSAHKLAVVGDMYELEEETEAEHRHIGALLQELAIPAWFCGVHMEAAAAACPGSLHFKDVAALKKHLSRHPVSNTVVLIKASRGMKLEGVVDSLG